MTKAHIVISPDPLATGTTQYALCRAELKNFQWLVQIETDFSGRNLWKAGKSERLWINPITTCRICYQQDWPDGYLYLARSGEVEGEVGGSHSRRGEE